MGHWYHYQKVAKNYEREISALKQKQGQGQQPLGVCALLFNSEGKLLLGKRKNSYGAGHYGVPGGRVEVNEPLEAAVQREVQEETALQLENPLFVGVIRENQGSYDFIHLVFAFFEVNEPPILCEPDKSEAWEWFSLKHLPEPILPGHQAGLELYREKRLLEDLTQ